MFFGSTNPTQSRAWFKASKYTLLICGILFLVCVVIFSIISSAMFRGSFLVMLAADLVAALLAYGIYVLWNTAPVRVRCPSCEKIVLSNTPWVCGFCGEK